MLPSAAEPFRHIQLKYLSYRLQNLKTTYDAGRNNETGHADLAWACMHAMDFEPLEGASEATTSVLEFS